MWRIRTHLLAGAVALALAALMARFGPSVLVLSGGMAVVVLYPVVRRKITRRREIFERVLPLVKGHLQSAISENPRIAAGDLRMRLMDAISGLGNMNPGVLRELTTNVDALLPALVQSLRASGDLTVDWEAQPPTGPGWQSATMQWMLSGYMMVWGGAVFGGLPLLHPVSANPGPHRDTTPMIWIGAGIILCGAVVIVVSELWARRSRRRSAFGTLACQPTD